MNYNEIMVTQAKSRVLRDLGVDIEPAKLILDEPLGADASGDFGGATIYINQNEKPGKIEEGKVYTVTTDSGSFTSVCKATTLEDNTALLFIGNGKLFALEDTGESFVISLLADEFSTMLYAVDYDNGSHMKIVSEETIHPIDPKFLPGVCLPVVELSTAPTAKGAVLSADEVAKIFDAFIPGIPIIVSAPLLDGLVTGVIMSGLVAEGIPLFGGAIRLNGTTHGYTILKVNDDVKFFHDEG